MVLELATKLSAAASTLNRIRKGNSSISAEMDLRLSKVFGRSPKVGWQCKTITICG